MVSTKFYSGYDGDFIYAKEWAEYGNISTERIQQLELEFLSAANWNIYVSNQVFFEKLKSIETILAKREGLKRGWLTYTELANLIPSISIAKAFLQYSALFTVSYAASVVTIAGALFLASQVPGTALYRSGKTEYTSSSSSSNNNNNAALSSNARDNLSQVENTNNIIQSQTELNNDTAINLQLYGCPIDTLDETFERLLSNNETFNNDNNNNIPMFTSNQFKSHAQRSVIIQPQKIAANFGQSIGIQTGVNLRSFLMDDDGDDTNLTDGLDLLTEELHAYWQTLRYDLFYVWVTAF